MSYNVMTWKQKIFDELVSRFTFLSLVCIVPLFFVDLTAENVKAYLGVTALVLGGGVAKTVVNGYKAAKGVQ